MAAVRCQNSCLSNYANRNNWAADCKSRKPPPSIGRQIGGLS